MKNWIKKRKHENHVFDNEITLFEFLNNNILYGNRLKGLIGQLPEIGSEVSSRRS